MPIEDGAVDPTDRSCCRSSSQPAVTSGICTEPLASVRVSVGGTVFAVCAEVTNDMEVSDGGADAAGDAS